MGKDHQWHWGGRFSKRGGDQNTSNKESSSPGCMSGVLHLFDFHQFQFPINYQPCFKPNSSSSSSSVLLQVDPVLPSASICKGVQAPRNSLESEENLFLKPSSSSPSQATDPKHGDHDLFHVPAAIHLETRTGKMGLMEGEVARIRVDELSSSEGSGSPGGPKTPTLVARLMGLDLLPEQCSLSLSSSAKGSINIKAQHHRRHSQDQNQFDSRQMVQSNNSKINRKKMNNNSYHEEISGSRSLPETPRISSARRSDVDASRLSLQINKENAMITEEFDHNLRRPSSREQIKFRRKDYHSRHHHHHDEENRNPSQYARQLVKQVKESVSRRVGMDITNTTAIAKSLDITNADHRENMASSKSKKRNCPTKTSDQEAHQIKHSTSSSSPRIRSQEHKIKPSPDQIPAVSKPLPILPSLAPVTEHCNQLQSKVTNLRTKSLQLPQQRTIDKYKKASCERFTQRKEPPIRTSPVAKANNLPEKNCKKTPLLKDLVGQVTKLEQSISSNQAHHNAQAVPTHPSQTTQQQRQKPRIGFQVQVSKPIISQLSSSSSRVAASYHENHYHHQVTLPFDCRDDNINRSTSTGRSSSSSSSDAEFRYVTEILKRPGIDRDTIVSFTARWFSPSHPLDPSIFEYLEQQQQQHPSPLTQRHNRKLIFDLVDEILVDILKPHLNMKPWLRSITKRYDLPLIKHKLINGNQLLQQLCSKIQTFPSANCQILQDIDDLIELDLPDYSTNQLLTILPILEEGEWIVFEIERDLLDSLVLETASAILARPPAPASWSDAV